jgi:hypothetical protein
MSSSVCTSPVQYFEAVSESSLQLAAQHSPLNQQWTQAGGVSCTTTSKNLASGTITSSFFLVRKRNSFTSSLSPFNSSVVSRAFFTKFHTSLATASAFRVPLFVPSVSVPPMPLGAASPSSEMSSAVIRPVERTIAPVSRERIRVLRTPGREERRARSAAVSSEGEGCCILSRWCVNEEMRRVRLVGLALSWYYLAVEMCRLL